MHDMAKDDNLKSPVPVDDDEDGMYDDEDGIDDILPSYIEATLTIPPCTLFQRRRRRSSEEDKPALAFRKPDAPLQFLPPDPTHIRCRCGRHVDTTQRSPHLPVGTVKCSCGYVVSSTGYACHPSQCSAAIPSSARQCSCGELFSDQMYDAFKLTYTCHCGATFGSDGKANRLCPFHQSVTADAKNVLCPCGRYVDTTAVYRVLHGTKKLTEGGLAKHPRVGWSHYDYTLHEETALCECGVFVKRDGSSGMGEHWMCCKVLSYKARESCPAGNENSCTCMQS